MKKVLTSLASVALFCGAAKAVVSENVFGVLRVDSSAEETIISVPWIEAAGSRGNIKVADLVLTSNLEVGDRLYYYQGTTTFDYLAWSLVANDGVKTWEAMQLVSGDDKITLSPGAATTAVPRGGALFVIRPRTGEQPARGPIYLYGQYTKDSAETKVAKGTPESETAGAQPVYTLLAPSGVNDVDINTVTMVGEPAKTDFIQIRGGQPLYYRAITGKTGKRWCTVTSSGFTKTYNDDPAVTTIPHGQGCWYVSEGGEPKFVWQTTVQSE